MKKKNKALFVALCILAGIGAFTILMYVFGFTFSQTTVGKVDWSIIWMAVGGVATVVIAGALVALVRKSRGRAGVGAGAVDELDVETLRELKEFHDLHRPAIEELTRIYNGENKQG